MLAGQHNVKIGDKFRVAFPKEFRDELGKTVILTYGFEKSLVAFSEESWSAFKAEIEGKSSLLPEVRSLRRIFIGGATTISFDSQGRFILPEYLREHGKIKTELLFIGLDTYVEIWDKKEWKEKQSEALKTMETIGEKLARNNTE